MPDARRLRKLVIVLTWMLAFRLVVKLTIEALVNGGCNYNGPKVA